MYVFLIVLTVIIAILLVIVVLVQKSKGGGLASNFSGGNQVLGVRHTNDFIEKTTWTLAGIILVLSVLSSFMIPNTQEGAAIRTQGVKSAPAAAAPATPVAPVAAPAAQAPAQPVTTPDAPKVEPPMAAGTAVPGEAATPVTPPAVEGQPGQGDIPK